MIGNFSQWAPYFPWLVGSFFVLLAVGIVLRRKSTRWIEDSHVLKIISELTANWKSKGYAYLLGVICICLFAVAMFALVPFQHILIPAPTKTAHWWYFPAVPEVMPSNEYWVLHMDKADPLYGTRSKYTFCAKGQEIDIDEREMVKDVSYRDLGDCIELLQYNYERENYPPYRVKKYPEEAFNGNR